MNDLTTSVINRKNILNNNSAIQAVYEQIGFNGIMFEGKYRFTKQQVANYFEIDIRTIDRLLENHKEELQTSGYELYTGTKLKNFKNTLSQLNDIDVVQFSENSDNEMVGLRATSIGIFTYKTFLNIGMLLNGSDKAKILRSAILDIVIDVLNKKLGGSTKYINQREEEFLPSAVREFDYRKEFTIALDIYVSKSTFKYGQLTDKIYNSIFKENTKEYRQILKLKNSESVRSTLYSEVLDLISSYENGFADFLKNKFEQINRQLSLSETHSLFNEYERITNATLNPLREKARSLMASRDMVFREAWHNKLAEYIKEVSTEDFDKFLGEKSKTLEERLLENQDVFKRLKNR